MIRLVMLILLFLVSLLAVFKAPAYYLWLLAIAVTEYAMIFASITAVVTVSGIWVQKFQLAGTLLGLATLLLFLSPIARALGIAKDMRHNLTQMLGPSVKLPAHGSPFGFGKLFRGTNLVSYHTLAYATYPGISLNLDYYPSQIAGAKPCIVVVHGGSWSSGDSKQLPELNSYLAARGYNVAAINYRMAPKYQNPAPVEDIKAAMSYLRKHATELHIDTNNFVLLGRSAGAQIALLTAYTLPEHTFKGVIDFYGPADMVWGYSVPSNPLIMNSRKVMEDYLGGTYGQVPEKYSASSPIEFVNAKTIPTLIIHGENDVLVSPHHSNRLNAKLTQFGVKHFLLKLPWATHGFDYNLHGPGGQLSTYAVETFLNTITQ
ncbi:MAG: alpha/beta hydrolase [Bacteroidota bacterium]|nr:alpha/beta hydrolase [Bacteroidota bacterium]